MYDCRLNWTPLSLTEIVNLCLICRTSNLAVYDICRLRTAHCRLQTADRKPQTTDCTLHTADCRPQIADYKLNDTKNLPNKGDVFKNIKLCESEKVTLGTRLIFLCRVTLASFPKCCWLFFTDPLSTLLAYH